MKTHLDKIGSIGAVIAAAACPLCFPKLALLGALFGLGAFGAYEVQFLVAAQVLVGVAIAGHALAYFRNRNPWLLALSFIGGIAVFAGLYLAGSELLVYLGFAALLAAGTAEFWHRFGRNSKERAA